MITDQLKTATLPAHQQLEKLLVHQIKAVDSTQKYLDLLQLFYGFCHPLEDVMMPLVSEAVIPDLAERRKSAALLQDIHYLQGSTEGMPFCSRIPILSNASEALGAMYVMEGSTLGGSIIADMIRKRVSGLPAESLSFFTSYGPATHAKWTSFKQQVDAFAATEQHKEAVIYGANETFQAFHDWIKQQQTTAIG